MPTSILMPSLSPTMEEGVLAKWLVKEGDFVKPGTMLCSVETDKTTVDYESMDEGYLRKIPIDPITKSAETWVPVYEEIDPDKPPAETEGGDELEPGIVDVRSGAPENSLDGTPYAEW